MEMVFSWPDALDRKRLRRLPVELPPTDRSFFFPDSIEGRRFRIMTPDGVAGEDSFEEEMLDVVPLRARLGIRVEEGAVEGGVG